MNGELQTVELENLKDHVRNLWKDHKRLRHLLKLEEKTLKHPLFASSCASDTLNQILCECDSIHERVEAMKESLNALGCSDFDLPPLPSLGNPTLVLGPGGEEFFEGGEEIATEDDVTPPIS